MWIVTRSINEYDQDGEYFVSAFVDKPDFKRLKKLFPNESDATIGKLTRGGGRQNAEYEWYELVETKEGEAYG